MHRWSDTAAVAACGSPRPTLDPLESRFRELFPPPSDCALFEDDVWFINVRRSKCADVDFNNRVWTGYRVIRWDHFEHYGGHNIPRTPYVSIPMRAGRD